MHIESRLVLEPSNVHNVISNDQFYIDHSKFTINNSLVTPLVASDSVVLQTTQEEDSRGNNWLVRLPSTTSSSENYSDCSSSFTSASSFTTQSQSIPSNVENANCDDLWELNPHDLELLELNLSEESPNSVTQLEYSPTNSLSANSQQYSVQRTSRIEEESPINSQFNTSSVSQFKYSPNNSISTSSLTTQSQSIPSNVENANCDDLWELNPHDLELLELNLSEESPNSVTQLEYSPTNSLSANSPQFYVQRTSFTEESPINSQFNTSSKTESSKKDGDSEEFKKPRNIFQVPDFFHNLANIHKEIPEDERWLYWYKENEILKIIPEKKDKIVELYAKIKGNKKSNYQNILRTIYDSDDFVKPTKEEDIGIHYTLKFTSRFISRSHISTAKYMHKVRSYLV